MKINRLVCLLGLALLVAGCASLLTSSLHSPQAVIPFEGTRVIAGTKTEAPTPTAPSIHELALAQEELAQDHHSLRAETEHLAVEQERLQQKLAALTQEMTQLYDAISNSPTVSTPPSTWHERMIARNRVPYEETREMLLSLTDESFPTVRTWYGKAWRESVQPFIQHRFPTKAERDRFAKLLDDIMEGERRRVELLAAAPESDEESPHSALPASHCLGPQWDRLSQNLADLRY